MVTVVSHDNNHFMLCDNHLYYLQNLSGFECNYILLNKFDDNVLFCFSFFKSTHGNLDNYKIFVSDSVSNKSEQYELVVPREPPSRFRLTSCSFIMGKPYVIIYGREIKNVNNPVDYIIDPVNRCYIKLKGFHYAYTTPRFLFLIDLFNNDCLILDAYDSTFWSFKGIYKVLWVFSVFSNHLPSLLQLADSTEQLCSSLIKIGGIRNWQHYAIMTDRKGALVVKCSGYPIMKCELFDYNIINETDIFNTFVNRIKCRIKKSNVIWQPVGECYEKLF